MAASSNNSAARRGPPPPPPRPNLTPTLITGEFNLGSEVSTDGKWEFTYAPGKTDAYSDVGIKYEGYVLILPFIASYHGTFDPNYGPGKDKVVQNNLAISLEEYSSSMNAEWKEKVTASLHQLFLNGEVIMDTFFNWAMASPAVVQLDVAAKAKARKSKTTAPAPVVSPPGAPTTYEDDDVIDTMRTSKAVHFACQIPIPSDKDTESSLAYKQYYHLKLKLPTSGFAKGEDRLDLPIDCILTFEGVKGSITRREFVERTSKKNFLVIGEAMISATQSNMGNPISATAVWLDFIEIKGRSTLSQAEKEMVAKRYNAYKASRSITGPVGRDDDGSGDDHAPSQGSGDGGERGPGVTAHAPDDVVAQPLSASSTTTSFSLSEIAAAPTQGESGASAAPSEEPLPSPPTRGTRPAPSSAAARADGKPAMKRAVGK
jgi:hypothetical protein